VHKVGFIYKIPLGSKLAGNNEMDFNESGIRHVDKRYPAAACKLSIEPSVSIKDRELVISQATTSFLWKNKAARNSLVK
jgi:hypothetical protein